MKKKLLLYLLLAISQANAQIHDDIKYLKSSHYSNSIDFLQQKDSIIKNSWEAGLSYINNFSQKRNSSFYNAKPGLYAYIQYRNRYKFKKSTLNFDPSLILGFNELNYSSFPQKYPTEYWMKWGNFINQFDNKEMSLNNQKFIFIPNNIFIEKKLKNNIVTIGYDRKKWSVGVLDDLVLSENSPTFFNIGLRSLSEKQRAKQPHFIYDIFLGALNSPQYTYEDNQLKIDGGSIIPQKNGSARGITGFNIFYQNNSKNNFLVGLNGISVFYFKNASLIDLIPGINYISSFFNSNNQNIIKTGSAYVKTNIKDEGLDLWAQYGYGNNYFLPQKLFLKDTLLSGYMIGARKRLRLGAGHTELFFQHSNLVNSTLNRSLRGESWYTHSFINQGYTNSGMVLGNGIGPGGVSTYLSASYIYKNKLIGIFTERLMQNQDLFYALFNSSDGVNNGAYRRHWMDLSVGTFTQIIKSDKIHHFSLSVTKSFNHQWQIKENWPYFFNKYGIDKWGFNIKYQVILNNAQ
jgi:hypothetical protein